VFLKSLTIKGFKSFADSTTLEFEPGVTVVVGPNGSGKSNIVDAVAWVLGAQGPRLLRSAKMEDVIFAGTPKRPALGRAEVSLTIDNQAGLLPIDFSEVTVTRTLFRSGDSEYAINGVPCRLLDVQELLSDTGVGRQQHVVVSQGQLDSVLNARPEDRRLIIEEAAGVLKYRRRKEKAERRLESTESSLLRLQDLLREVRRQLGPLQRQAEAARRHGDLVDELLALRRFLAGRDLATIDSRLARCHASRSDLAQAEREVRRALTALDITVSANEAELSRARSVADTADLADALSRAEGLRARARGVCAVLAERRRSVTRDRSAAVDTDLVANLEAEAARLADDLAEGDRSMGELAAASSDEAAADASLRAETEAFERDCRSSSTDAPETTAAKARTELGALTNGVERGRAELRRIEALLEAVAHRASRLSRDAVSQEELLRQLAEAEPVAVAADEEGKRGAEAAAVALRSVESAARSAELEHQRWMARTDALAAERVEARARAGGERLAGVSGFVGGILVLVEVDEGWGAAFEAAAGEAASAIVMQDAAAARRAIEHLKRLDAADSVVALPDPAEATRSESQLEDLPAGVEAVRSHVRGRLPGLGQLLDRLLAGAIAVPGDWVDALDLAMTRPDLTVVTRDGDRFAPAGWQARPAGSATSGAALEEARTRLSETAGLAARLAAEAATSRSEAERCRELSSQEAQGLAALRAQIPQVEQALRRLRRDADDAAAEQEPLATQRLELAGRLAGEERQMEELAKQLPAIEEAAAAAVNRALAERAARARLAGRAAAIAARRRELEVRAAGLKERRDLLVSRGTAIEQQLRNHAAARSDAAARRQRLGVVAEVTQRLQLMVESRAEQLDNLVEQLRQARRQEADASRAIMERLEQLRRERATAEHQLADVRERSSRTELDEAETRVRLEALVDGARRELDCEPEQLRTALCPPLAAGTSATSRVRELEREIRLMGPINPLALEEHSALQDRHTFLEGQLNDVRSARRELSKVIKAIDAEIVDVFHAAFADTADNFERLFATLFPGGQGRLRLTDPDQPLETGIEVEARPSGKNVRRLSLLSGGERSLAALAFLFAVFRSRPSPFYLLDEVEAALDDVNLHRFLDLMHEFRDEAQLLVVSHQKRTMEAADCLYGVTMQPGGSSRVVSERVTAVT
jgi:chromosome segregation protein